MTNLAELPYLFTQRTDARFEFLFGKEKTPALMDRIINLINEFAQKESCSKHQKWSETDAILITYADSIIQKGEKPLSTLFDFLKQRLSNTVNIIHILPYFPFSSDDGFAVIDYREVNPDFGDWSDINRIGSQFKLMTDLVISHVSREHLWFVDYLSDVEPGRDYFIEVDPNTDVSAIVRPRNTPLIVPVHTHRGLRHVWATFGEDQIDVNFENPDVLFEFIEILLFYIKNKTQVIRLDAVAYLWKNLGSRCINLRETHEIVKLIRDILEIVSPNAILITETNVPNGENVSYFGNSDEAHMVYQFTLPPLLLHALYQGNSHYLSAWSMEMPRPPRGCTYLNFLASHDGIGLRPVEGILPEQEVIGLVEAMHQHGAFVSMKANSNGIDTPYEINIALFDALKGTKNGVDQWQVRRFVCSHAIMLSLQGIPAIYIHSFTATPNDGYGVEQTGRTRSINRHKWDYSALLELLNNPCTPNAEVFRSLKHLLSVRRRQKAFHPEATQKTLFINAYVFTLWRHSLDKHQSILAISNLTAASQTIELPAHPKPAGPKIWRELIAATALAGDTAQIDLQPYQTVWLEALD